MVIDGVELAVDELPADVRELITIYERWSTEELVKAKIEVFKLEAAVAQISTEIQKRVVAFRLQTGAP
jgi:hypothetical protein